MMLKWSVQYIYKIWQHRSRAFLPVVTHFKTFHFKFLLLLLFLNEFTSDGVDGRRVTRKRSRKCSICISRINFRTYLDRINTEGNFVNFQNMSLRDWSLERKLTILTWSFFFFFLSPPYKACLLSRQKQQPIFDDFILIGYY